MVSIVHFLLITQIIFAVSEPIDDGSDVGYIQTDANGENTVVNPGTFSSIVHLDIQSEEIKYVPKRVALEVHMSCGGSLIRNHIVLTAAHCLENPKSIEKITAWVGVVDTKLEEGKGQQIPVRGFTIHEFYVESKGRFYLMNDIAILFLHKPAIINDYVKLAKLPPKNFVIGGKLGWIIGWGRQSCGTKKSMLQKAAMRGISPVDCYEYWQPIMIPNNFICALSDDERKTTTRGDSGGPFIVEDYVVGVSSFGATDSEKSDEKNGIIACDPTIPTVFTFVSKYLDWIKKTINAGPKVVLIKRRRFPPRGISVPPPTVPPSRRGSKL